MDILCRWGIELWSGVGVLDRVRYFQWDGEVDKEEKLTILRWDDILLLLYVLSLILSGLVKLNNQYEIWMDDWRLLELNEVQDENINLLVKGSEI